MGRPSLCDGLDENAKLLQTHVSSSTHPNNTDTQTLIVCWWTAKMENSIQRITVWTCSTHLLEPQKGILPARNTRLSFI